MLSKAIVGACASRDRRFAEKDLERIWSTNSSFKTARDLTE